MASSELVATPLGDARAHFYEPDGNPIAVLALGHGAGGGINARDLTGLASKLPAEGIRVVLIEQPWKVAGKKIAVQAPKLDIGWNGAIEGLGLIGSDVPLVTGGRSAGARVACRTAEHTESAGVVCLSFPLHLPGKPERSRIDELLTPACPVLVFQGTKDTFGTSVEVLSSVGSSHPNIDVTVIEGADHGMRVPAKLEGGQAGALRRMSEDTAAFVRKCAGAGPAG